MLHDDAVRGPLMRGGGDMGRRLLSGLCAPLLLLGVAACGDGEPSEASASPSETAVVGEARAQKCTKVVTAAVADKLWIDSGRVTDDDESHERNERNRTFAANYLGSPEMDIFMRTNGDAVNGGATITEALAMSTNPITEKCSAAYP
ncbi:hypothetical protein [Streptomyces sp. NPDC046862]|uniref:hypothetical protein n=1 Tax=Streptomyces sp. NPDC046862 TaxID=3154603 RepID=UPI0034530936